VLAHRRCFLRQIQSLLDLQTTSKRRFKRVTGDRPLRDRYYRRISKLRDACPISCVGLVSKDLCLSVANAVRFSLVPDPQTSYLGKTEHGTERREVRLSAASAGVAGMDIRQDGGLSPQPPWYAIRTRSNYEKLAAKNLQAKGFEQYLPLQRARKVWSDRVIETSIPLFAGYVFCKFDVGSRSPILSTPGVASIVSVAGKPAIIPSSEIEAIQTVLGSGRKTETCPYLCEGQMIQVNRGPLRGLRGILIKKLKCRLVISVLLLHRSLAVEIDLDCITPINTHKP